MPDTHVMLSYQWDNQHLVEEVYEALKVNGIPVWMALHRDMIGKLHESAAYGVEHASVVCCFLSTKYQESWNCKKELSYAYLLGKHIIPCKTEPDFQESRWLSVITTGLPYIDLRKESNNKIKIDSFVKELKHRIEMQTVSYNQGHTKEQTNPDEHATDNQPIKDIQATITTRG